MPRYFFDLYNDTNARDAEGRELGGLDEVWDAAIVEAREILQAGVVEKGEIDLSHRIEVRDESGAVACTMCFADALTVRHGAELLNTADGR